mgnify:FL=1
MVKGYGKELKAIHIMENGLMDKLKVKVFISGLMELDMKGNLRNL